MRSDNGVRVFSDDREPQHNGGADDKHSLSEDVFLFFFNPREQRRPSIT